MTLWEVCYGCWPQVEAMDMVIYEPRDNQRDCLLCRLLTVLV